MATMAVSDLRVIAQVGTTIAIGLLFDTLVIRVVHDAVDRGADGTLVLVAAAGEHARGATGTAGTVGVRIP